jgi:imidazole glycerol phosphate synthase glutamine amidotransferase subunit
MIGILDYGAGNLASVKNAMLFLGYDAEVVTVSKDIKKYDGMIFPGQGSFGSMIDTLKGRGMYYKLYDFIDDGKPFLGICLGLQVLFEGSDESPDHEGYGIMKGRAKRFTNGKVPQIGWNRIIPTQEGIKAGWAYYVNSYRIVDSHHCIANSDYFGRFVAAVRKDNITAFQFHPEKSGEYGLSLIRWWYRCLQKE